MGDLIGGGRKRDIELAETVEVFVLRRGAYELLGKWGRGEEAHSQVLAGFRVAVDELFGE